MNGVRTADVRDADAIARIHVTSWQKAYRGIIPADFLDGLSVAKRSEFWSSRLASARGNTLVFERDSEVAGFADFGASRDEHAPAKTGELNAMYVEPRYWRTGCGRALLAEAERALRGACFKRVTLWVLEDNHPARKFYERHGLNLDGASKKITFSGNALTELRYARDIGIA